MEVTEGKLSYAMSLDDSQMANARDNIMKYFEEIGYSAEEAGKMADEAMHTIGEAVSEAMKEVGSEAEALDVLKVAFEEMKDQLASMDEGEAKEVLQGVVDGFESVINEMEEAIEKNGELGESFNSVSDIMLKLLGGQENYNKIISNLPEPLKNAITGIQGMTTAAKAFIATPLGATIAAIVLALQAMRTWLNSSVEGQLKLAEITGYLQGVLGQLKEIVITVGERLFKAFKDPKQAIQDFWEALKKNVVNRLKAVGDIAASIGKILKSAFTLDLDGVKEAVKELGESFIQLGTGVDDLPSKIKERVGKIGDAAKEQAAINRERKELEIAESQWNIRRAELQKLMNEASATMYDTSLTKAQRKKALDDFKKYNQEILNAEEGFIDKKIALQQREMELTTNGIEDENTLRDLQAQKIEKQAEAAQRLAMLQRRSNSIDRVGVSEAKAEIKAAEKVAKELTELKQRNAEQNLALMREGYAKEIAAATVAYQEELTKIELLEKKWKKAQRGVLTGEQTDELVKARQLAAEKMEKANADAMKNMLEDYKSYEQKIADLERNYSNFVGYVRAEAYKTDEQGKFIHNEQEILEYEKAITKAIKEQAKERLNLDLDEIDATVYDTIEERMEAINAAYQTYIDNLVKAGATEAEIAAVEQERVETAGRLSAINAKIDSIEAQKLVAIDKGDADEVKRLNAEIAKLQRELNRINKEADKKSISDMFKDWADSLKTSDFTDAGAVIGDMVANIGEASGNDGVQGFGEALSFVGSVGTKIASGDYLGAALEVIVKIGTAIAEDIAQVNAFNKANEQAAVAAKQIKIDNLLTGENGIFGDNAVEQVANYIDAMDSAKRGLGQLGVTGSKTFKVLDRSWFINFFGGDDKYSSLAEFARKNGMELYDAYGNINADVLQLFKDTYTEIDEEGQQWLDNAIRYTDQYAEAMEGMASYLEGIFGNTIDTIVDQMFEGGLDIKAITSDVGKQMAKDLMKAAIMSEYFGDLKDQIADILKQEGGMTDRASAEIFAMYSEAMAAFENDLPQWQNIMHQYQEAFDFDTDAASIGPGTALSSASQESIDLANGQLNAMRTVQGRMESTINSVLLEMRGFRGDMNSHLSHSNSKLDEIANNTSQSGLVRSLGAYFG